MSLRLKRTRHVSVDAKKSFYMWTHQKKNLYISIQTYLLHYSFIGVVFIAILRFCTILSVMEMQLVISRWPSRPLKVAPSTHYLPLRPLAWKHSNVLSFSCGFMSVNVCLLPCLCNSSETNEEWETCEGVAGKNKELIYSPQGLPLSPATISSLPELGRAGSPVGQADMSGNVLLCLLQHPTLVSFLFGYTLYASIPTQQRTNA